MMVGNSFNPAVSYVLIPDRHLPGEARGANGAAASAHVCPGRKLCGHVPSARNFNESGFGYLGVLRLLHNSRRQRRKAHQLIDRDAGLAKHTGRVALAVTMLLDKARNGFVLVYRSEIRALNGLDERQLVYPTLGSYGDAERNPLPSSGDARAAASGFLAACIENVVTPGYWPPRLSPHIRDRSSIASPVMKISTLLYSLSAATFAFWLFLFNSGAGVY